MEYRTGRKRQESRPEKTTVISGQVLTWGGGSGVERGGMRPSVVLKRLRTGIPLSRNENLCSSSQREECTWAWIQTVSQGLSRGLQEGGVQAWGLRVLRRYLCSTPALRIFSKGLNPIWAPEPNSKVCAWRRPSQTIQRHQQNVL